MTTDMVLKCLIYGDYDTGKTVMLAGAAQLWQQRGVEYSYLEMKDGSGDRLNIMGLRGRRIVDQAERVARGSSYHNNRSHILTSNNPPAVDGSSEVPDTLKGHVILYPGKSLGELAIPYPQTLRQLHQLSFAIPWQGEPRTKARRYISLS